MRRHRLRLESSLILATAILAGCAGTNPPAATAPDQGTETFPDLPTANASAGDPFDTLPPEPTPTPTGANLASLYCAVSPAIVLPGEPYTLLVAEDGAWYGSDRYYQITGLPSSYHELQTADGGPAQRPVIQDVAPDLEDTTWTIDVFMRDWDIHGIRPGVVLPTFIRPASSQHEGSCAATFKIARLP